MRKVGGGVLDAVKAFITLQPKLIDAAGPHGFSLHFHAQVGGKAGTNLGQHRLNNVGAGLHGVEREQGRAQV